MGLGAGPRTQPSVFPRSAAGELDLGASGGLSRSDTTLVLLDQMHPEPLSAGRAQSRRGGSASQSRWELGFGTSWGLSWPQRLPRGFTWPQGAPAPGAFLLPLPWLWGGDLGGAGSQGPWGPGLSSQLSWGPWPGVVLQHLGGQRRPRFLLPS